jgi:hypothetical protein
VHWQRLVAVGSVTKYVAASCGDSCRCAEKEAATHPAPTSPPAPGPCSSPSSCPCSFLLQLGLLDLDCSGYAPSLQAAAALSLSLATFGKPGWPLSLQQFGSYLEADLAPCKARLAELQATQVGGRAGCCNAWLLRHTGHSVCLSSAF